MLVEAIVHAESRLDAAPTLEANRGVAYRSSFLHSSTDAGLSPSEAIAQATKATTLCYLLTGPSEGRAIIVGDEGNARATAMPGFDVSSVDQLASELLAREADHSDRGPDRFEEFLGDLADEMWSAGLGDVIEALPPGQNVTFVPPVGPLAFLPLHGAREHTGDDDYRYASDAVSISSATNAANLADGRRALGPARHGRPAAADRVVGV